MKKKKKKLLNGSNDPKFVTRKWNIVSGQLNVNYDVGNEIIYNTEILKPNLCDYNNAYILVRSDTTVIVTPAKQVSFKTCAPYSKCITKINGATIGDAEDLDIFMPIYNLIDYSSKLF